MGDVVQAKVRDIEAGTEGKGRYATFTQSMRGYIGQTLSFSPDSQSKDWYWSQGFIWYKSWLEPLKSKRKKKTVIPKQYSDVNLWNM